MRCSYFWGNPHWWGGSNPFSWLVTILLVALLAYVLIRVFQSLRPGDTARADQDHSLEILRRKFASQEISEEEYTRMRDILKS